MKRRRSTKTSDAEEPMDTSEDKTPVTLSTERYLMTSPYWWTKVSSNSEIGIQLCIKFPPPPPRGLMSRYYGRKSFWFQQSFLTETAICIVKRWKKEWATVLFLCAILHRKVIPDNFFVFFPVIFTGPRLLRSRNFATMATWRNDLSILDGILLKKCLVFKPGLCYRHRLRCCHSYCSSTLKARYAFLPLPFFWMNRKSQLLKKSQLRKNQVKCKNKCSVSFPKRWSWRALISTLKENS